MQFWNNGAQSKDVGMAVLCRRACPWAWALFAPLKDADKALPRRQGAGISRTNRKMDAENKPLTNVGLMLYNGNNYTNSLFIDMIRLLIFTPPGNRRSSFRYFPASMGSKRFTLQQGMHFNGTSKISADNGKTVTMESLSKAQHLPSLP